MRLFRPCWDPAPHRWHTWWGEQFICFGVRRKP